MRKFDWILIGAVAGTLGVASLSVAEILSKL